MPDLPATPTLDKRSAVIEESQAIGRFLDWMSDQGIILGRWGREWYELDGERYETEERILPTHEGPSALLHRYFDIDPQAEENELRALLDAIRKNNA